MRRQDTSKRTLTAAAAAALIALAPATGPAWGQEGGDPALGERVWRELSNCGDCHGWAGDGVPNIAQRNGANLRDSFLTPAMAYEVIRCGRPGTAMPSFRRNTWSEIIPCYGMTAPMAPGVQPVRSDSPMSDRFVEAVVAFIFEDFVGAGPVTREYCSGVFGEGNPRCNGYPPAGDPGPGDPPAPAAEAAPPLVPARSMDH